MFTNSRKWLAGGLVLTLAVLACNLPGGAPQGTEEAPPSITETPTALATMTDTPIPDSQAEDCRPTVVATTLANIRSGPGQAYSILGNLPQGATANVAGRNAENTWWYIEFPGGANGYAWISATVTTPACIPDTLAIIAAPPAAVEAATEPPQEGAAAVPSATATSGLIFIIPPGGFILIPSPTPTFIFFIPPGGFPIMP